jgi:hypothetical protein
VSPVFESLEQRRLLAADIVATEVTGKLPDDLVDGTRPRIPGIGVNINNAGDTAIKTPVVVRLFASADGILDAGDTLLQEQTTKLAVKAGGHKHIPIKLRDNVPNLAQAAYQLIANVDATNVVPETNDANNTVATGTTVAIGPAFVNLTATDLTGKSNVRRGKPASFSLVALNGGNVTAKGTGSVNITFTPVGQQGGTAVAAPVKINVKSRKTGKLKGKVVVPAGLAAGQYTVTATLTTTTGFTDTNAADNTATAGPITVA